MFEAVTTRAAALGMSRSEFFSVAAQRYLRDLDEQSLTGRIDGLLERIAMSEDESSRVAREAGRMLLEDQEW